MVLMIFLLNDLHVITKTPTTMLTLKKYKASYFTSKVGLFGNSKESQFRMSML